MAADDARALALLLNCPYVNVLAVVTSDGVSPPDVGATNVCRMLGFLKQDGVAVGMGRSLAAPAPAFRTNATGLDWAQLGEPVVPVGGMSGADQSDPVRAAESRPSNRGVRLSRAADEPGGCAGAETRAGEDDQHGVVVWHAAERGAGDVECRRATKRR